MTALREEIIDYVKMIPEEKLIVLQPLLYMLSENKIIIEKITDDDITDEEHQAFDEAENEYKNGVSIDFNDYLRERGVAAG